MKTSLLHLQNNALLLIVAFLFSTCKEKEPVALPKANFEFFPNTNLVAPVKITFTNTSQNATGYLWETSDGQTSIYKDITYTINSGGKYSMKLTATGEGGTDTYSRSFVVADAPSLQPIAGFTYSPANNLTAPVKVTFSNSSKNADSYKWDFGDGTTSTEANPTKEFTKAGTFKVKLTAFAKTSSSESTADITVNATVATTPTADFTYSPSSNLTAPANITFTNTSKNANTYKWDFGDGTTSTTASPTKEFTKAGDFTVKLTATDSKNQSAQKTVTISVKAAAVLPVADWTWKASNLKVTFTNTSKNANSYKWNFGDGNTSTASSPTYEYAKAGTYTATLTASDGKNQDQDSKLVTITAPIVPTCDWATYSTATAIKVETRWGDCGADGLGIKITNLTKIKLEAYWCFKKKDGTWSCEASSIAAGSYHSTWSCKNTGDVKVWAMSADEFKKNNCGYSSLKP